MAKKGEQGSARKDAKPGNIIRSSLFRKDSWVNFLKGLSGSSDATRNTYFGDVPLLDDQELSRMWVGEGIGKKIVSKPADDMTRNWFEIPNDPDGKILAELKRLNGRTEITNALKWARLYRGGVIVMGLQDGQELEKPVAKTVNGIEWLKVYPASKINISSTDIISDTKSPYFEDVETFPIQKRNGDIVNVHRSRCLLFKGETIPDVADAIDDTYLYWGVSILQSIWTQLTNYGGISQSIVNLLYEAVIGKYKFSNLAQLLSEGNTEAIYTRMEIINAGKGIINAVMLGEGEEYTRDSANMTSIPDMMDRFMMNLSAAAEIPVAILFGRSPAGENSTGDADFRSYYDMIASKQETWLGPPLQELVNIIGGYLKISEPEITFNPVWEPSQKELVEMRKNQAETDVHYINTGVLSPEEVAESRFIGGYSFETSIDEEARAKEPVEPPKPIEEPEEEEEEEEE